MKKRLLVLSGVNMDKTSNFRENIGMLTSLLKNGFNLFLLLVISIALELFFIYGKMIKVISDYFLFGAASILAGLIIVISVHKIRTRRSCSIKEVGSGSGGLFLGIFAQMPVCCAPLTLAMFGLTGASVFLAQYGSWLVYLSILILGLTFILSIKTLERIR